MVILEYTWLNNIQSTRGNTNHWSIGRIQNASYDVAVPYAETDMTEFGFSDERICQNISAQIAGVVGNNPLVSVFDLELETTSSKKFLPYNNAAGS